MAERQATGTRYAGVGLCFHISHNPKTKIGSKMGGAPTPKWASISSDPQPYTKVPFWAHLLEHEGFHQTVAVSATATAKPKSTRLLHGNCSQASAPRDMETAKIRRWRSVPEKRRIFACWIFGYYLGLTSTNRCLADFLQRVCLSIRHHNHFAAERKTNENETITLSQGAESLLQMLLLNSPFLLGMSIHSDVISLEAMTHRMNDTCLSRT